MNRPLARGVPLNIFVAIVFSMLALASSGAELKDCRLKRLSSIELKVDKTVLAPVTLNGTQTYMGLLTGSSTSTISKKAAEEMRLPLVPAPSVYAKDRNTAGQTLVDSFSIGTLKFGKTTFLVSSGLAQEAGENMPEFIGWFGMQSLSGVDFEFDFAHNKLNLFSIAHCVGEVVYWTDTATSVPYTLDGLGALVFPMELDGKRIEATVQASLAHTRLKTDVSKKAYGFDETSPGIKSVNTDTGAPQSHYLAMKMTAKGLSVTNADVYLVPGRKECEVSYKAGPQHAVGYVNCVGSPPLTLGLDVLRRLRLYFATKEHILYISAADAETPAATGDR